MSPALAPEHAIGYSCFNEAGEFCNGVVTPDGILLSVSGPARLKPADQ